MGSRDDARTRASHFGTMQSMRHPGCARRGHLRRGRDRAVRERGMLSSMAASHERRPVVLGRLCSHVRHRAPDTAQPARPTTVWELSVLPHCARFVMSENAPPQTLTLSVPKRVPEVPFLPTLPLAIITRRPRPPSAYRWRDHRHGDVVHRCSPMASPTPAPPITVTLTASRRGGANTNAALR